MEESIVANTLPNKKLRIRKMTRSDVTPEVIHFTNMLTDTRNELMEEMLEQTTEKRSKCYIANLQIDGILTKALIDTGAEVTCISDDSMKYCSE